VSQQPHPVLRFEGQKDRIQHPLFCQMLQARYACILE